MNTKEYFEKRALATEKHSKQRSDKYLSELKKTYESVDNQIKKDIESWYKKYAIENEISNIDARKILNSTELKDYKKYIKSLINKSNLTGQNKEDLRKKYIKSKIDRLTALQKQVELNLDILTGNYESSAKRHLIENYKQVYSEQAHTFDNANIFTFNLNFNAFDERAIESIVRTKWSNKDFSTRIWGHNKNMVREMTNILSTGIALGYSVDKMSKQISSRLDVNYSNAKRLIRTESNYVLSEATHDLYKDVELEQYQFLATLDFKTSEICQELDNKIFFVKDRKVGLNCNPMHPNCRSTTIPYLPEYMDENDTRIARDIDGTSYKVPANMDYKSWYQSMVDKYSDTPNIIGNQEKKYSKSDAKKIAKTADNIISKYINIPSKWSGNLIFEDLGKDKLGSKMWNCNIRLNFQEGKVRTSIHVLMHELLHARSISYYDIQTYRKHRGIEEGSVQFLNEQISRKEKIKTIDSGYNEYIDVLKQINKTIKYGSDLDFAIDLFNVPVVDRIQWLNDKMVDFGFKNGYTYEEINNFVNLLSIF